MPTPNTTEYKQTAKLKDNEIDLLQGRMSYSILDVIAHMRACEMSEKEIKQLILRDVEQIIDTDFELEMMTGEAIHYREYKKLGGQKSEKKYCKNRRIFLEETMDIFVGGNTTKHDSREEAMKAVMVKAKISVEEVNLIFHSLDNLVSYT